jgi:hypothetical protein
MGERYILAHSLCGCSKIPRSLHRQYPCYAEPSELRVAVQFPSSRAIFHIDTDVGSHAASCWFRKPTLRYSRFAHADRISSFVPTAPQASSKPVPKRTASQRWPIRSPAEYQHPSRSRSKRQRMTITNNQDCGDGVYVAHPYVPLANLHPSPR